MIQFTLIVIIVNAGTAQPAPVVQEQPVIQDQPQPIDLDPMRWHCPACGWWNTYTSISSLKNGSKQHLKRCPKK